MGKTQAFQKRLVLVKIVAGSALVSVPSIGLISLTSRRVTGLEKQQSDHNPCL